MNIQEFSKQTSIYGMGIGSQPVVQDQNFSLIIQY